MTPSKKGKLNLDTQVYKRRLTRSLLAESSASIMDNVLEALLSTVPTADGRDDEFERLWDHVLTAQAKPLTQPLGPIISTNSSATSGPPPPSTDACRG